MPLQVEGRVFRAHKAVLAAASPYFSAMYCNKFRESGQDPVNLQVSPYLCFTQICPKKERGTNQHLVNQQGYESFWRLLGDFDILLPYYF